MDKVKILVPVDNLEMANIIIRAVFSFIDKNKAEITLLNTIESFEEQELFYSFPQKYIKYMARRKRFDEIIEFLNKEKISNNGVIFQHGNASKNILKELELGKYDLVAMGSHNKKLYERFFVGSTSYKVIKRSPCSILLLNSSSDVKIIKGDFDVFAAVEGSIYSKQTILLSAKLLDNNRAKYTIFNAKIPLENILPIDMYQYPDVSKIIEEATLIAREVINGAADLAEKLGLNVVKKFIGEGDAAECILKESEKLNSNLILIGSTAHSDFTQFFTGSVATKIYENSKSPVLIIRNRAISQE